MSTPSTADRYAVFGQPIAQSLSPCIHALFARQIGITIDYRTIESSRADFAEHLAAFADGGGRGANVTLPLKEHAPTQCATLSARASRAGSVNTLCREGDAWHGDSTDGAGLLRDLCERHRFEPSGKRIALLGAGGAARAVAFAFIDADVGELVIANRTRERAVELAAALGADDRVGVCTWDALVALADVDLLVNATAAGHATSTVAFPFHTVSAATLCYDLSYGNAARVFLDCARNAGAARVSDGLGMLVEQAADAFALWHGVRPDTEAVYANLRADSPLHDL